MCSCFSKFPPELWYTIICHLTRRCLVELSRASPCCYEMVRSQVNRRIVHYLSSQTPYQLKMILSDPATMQRSETLELTASRDPVKHLFFQSMTHTAKRIAPLQDYISLKLSRTQRLDGLNVDSVGSDAISQASLQDNYSKIIQFDELDFIYHMCFAIHKCKRGSFISVGNLCGERMKMIRLWTHWFTNAKPQYRHGSSTPCAHLFTKLVWSDSSFDVGFIVSAHECAPPDSSPIHPGSNIMTGLCWNSESYRIEIEEVIIRDQYLLGLFEGFSN